MKAGAPDKVVYEACGSCLPVLASNPSFDELFEGIEPPLRVRARAARRSSPSGCARSRRSPRQRARCDRRDPARAGARRATRSTPGRTASLPSLAHDEERRGSSTSPRSPASPAPRRTCSRSCRALARARLGRPLPDAARARAGRVELRARADASTASSSTRSRSAPTSTRSRSCGVCALPRADAADDPAHAPRPRRRLRAARGDARRACRSA